MRAVFDANVVAAAVCWSGDPFLCLVKMARRRVFAYGTTETLEETREVVAELFRNKKPKHNASARLTWYMEKLKLVDAAPLGKQRSRDPKDDPYIAAALAGRVDCIVTFDRDLLDLGKPFGIAVITPAQFLKTIEN
jgi:putative PIN family toxin of toxin-antitoxin system